MAKPSAAQPRQVEGKLYRIQREGRKPLYRVVVRPEEMEGFEKAKFARCRIQVAGGAARAPFVAQLLRKGSNFMVTLPSDVVESAGVAAEAQNVTLHLLGVASGKEAAEASGRRTEPRRAGSKPEPPMGQQEGRLPVEAPAEPPAGPGEAEALRAEVTALRAQVAALQGQLTGLMEGRAGQEAKAPPPSVGEQAKAAEEEAAGAAPKQPEPEPAAKVGVEPKGPMLKPRMRAGLGGHVQDEHMAAIRRVLALEVEMKKHIIYIHLAPQIVLGRLKTKREIDAAVDEVYRAVEENGPLPPRLAELLRDSFGLAGEMA